MEKLYKILKVVTFPFFWLLNLIPKNDKIIIFGSQFGSAYSDNSRYYFEYCCGRKDFQVYWITKSRITYKSLADKNLPVLYAWSFRGFFKAISAKYTVVSYSRMTDLPFYVSRDVCFQLWHGTPLKKIRYDVHNLAKRNGLINSLSKYMYQAFFERHDYVISSGELSSIIFNKALFSYSPAFRVLEFGYPRNDALFDFDSRLSPNKTILYMPTFRGHGKLDPLISTPGGLERLSVVCNKNGFRLLVKLHPNCRMCFDTSALPGDVVFYDDDVDTQSLLRLADILISDYSSCVFDFLITKKPIILYWSDYLDYREVTGFYDNIYNNLITLGIPIVNDLTELELVLGGLVEGIFSVDEDIDRLFNRYSDGLSSERLYDFMLKNSL